MVQNFLNKFFHFSLFLNNSLEKIIEFALSVCFSLKQLKCFVWVYKEILHKFKKQKRRKEGGERETHRHPEANLIHGNTGKNIIKKDCRNQIEWDEKCLVLTSKKEHLWLGIFESLEYKYQLLSLSQKFPIRFLVKNSLINYQHGIMIWINKIIEKS